MVEEYQAGGVTGDRGDLPYVSVCWYGVWVAGLGTVLWEVKRFSARRSFSMHNVVIVFFFFFGSYIYLVFWHLTKLVN